MQVMVRAAFFLWLTAVNLVALSSVWARIAEVFDSNASKRLFGFLGAGATCGDAPWSCRAVLPSCLLPGCRQFPDHGVLMRKGQVALHGTAAQAESLHGYLPCCHSSMVFYREDEK